MALRHSYTHPSGLLAPEAYHRVEQVSGSKAGVQITLRIYRDAAAVTDGLPCVNEIAFHFVPALDAGDWDAQAYQHLKGLPEFEGAEDC